MAIRKNKVKVPTSFTVPESSLVGYFIVTDRGIIRQVNLRGALLLGVEHNELLNRELGNFVTPEHIGRWQRHLQAVLQHEERQDCELLLRCEDGSLFVTHLDSIWRPDLSGDSQQGRPGQREMDGETGLIHIALFDITDCTHKEGEYRTLIQTSLDGFWAIDLNGRILDVNESICRIVGYTREELLRMSISDIEVEESSAEMARHIPEVMRTGGGLFQTHYHHKDGAVIDVEIRAQYVVELGERLFVFVRDITARREEEAALQVRDLNLRSRIAHIFLTCPDDMMFREALQVILETMQSPQGLFGYIDDQGALVVPFITQDNGKLDNVPSPTNIFPANAWPENSWSLALREKKTVCANTFSPAAPADHVALQRHISLPIVFQDRVVGLLQVANKKTKYCVADVQMLEAIATYIAPILNARLEHKRAEDLIQNVLACFDEGFVIVNRSLEVITANRAYLENFNLPLGGIIGQRFHEVTFYFGSPCEESGEVSAVQQVFATGESCVFVHTCRDSEGKPFYIETKAYPLSRNDLGEVQTAIEIVADITEQRNQEAEIHQLAFYDPLTLLPNRRLLQDRLQQAFNASARSGQYGAILVLDLDNFKILNDTRGHAVGDLLLVEVAQRMLSLVREGDTVSRQGGDEFVVLLQNLAVVEKEASIQAGHVGEKIRASLGLPYNLKGYEHHCTPSIGISLFRGHEMMAETLLKHADAAMYEAKAGGRNVVRFFDPVMQAALEASSALTADLYQAIQKHQFQLYYQLQTDDEQRVIGVEALLRWLHPRRGMVPPEEFIPLAEETGLILPIGRWVLQKACEQIKSWADLPGAAGLRVAVNISPRQFRQPEFVAEVLQVLEKTGADPALLKIELSENLVLEDVAGAVNKMVSLKAAGVTFSMDDFGTSYSTLSCIKRLPFEQLKIDKSFIRDIGLDPNDDAIIQTIIAMGKTLGLQVIAEGVETRRQMAFLQHHGCQAYQGYLCSRPLPAVEFERLLATLE